jgi:hypothetical protein
MSSTDQHHGATQFQGVLINRRKRLCDRVLKAACAEPSRGRDVRFIRRLCPVKERSPIGRRVKGEELNRSLSSEHLLLSEYGAGAVLYRSLGAAMSKVP